MALGLGTAALGRPQYINIKQKNGAQIQNLATFKAQGISVLEKAYELGVRYFDTAPGYGLAEQLLINWLQSKNDTSLTVGTKWGYTYIADFDPNAKIHEIKEHSLSKLNEQWNASKVLLPHLKIYQIHSATLETGVLDNLKILNKLALLKNEYGLQIGITTTGTNQVEVIKKALDVLVGGKPLFDAFQVTYNVLDQSLNTISEELIQQNKKIIIKEALANGRLFRNEKYTHYNKLYNELDTLANKYNTTVDSILLNFCEQTIPKSIVLSGASNSEHLTSNFSMNNFKLSVDDLEKLTTFQIDAITYWQERKQLNWN